MEITDQVKFGSYNLYKYAAMNVWLLTKID